MHSEWGRTIFDKTKLLEHLRSVGFKFFSQNSGSIFGTLENKKQKMSKMMEFWNQPTYIVNDTRGRNNVG